MPLDCPTCLYLYVTPFIHSFCSFLSSLLYSTFHMLPVNVPNNQMVTVTLLQGTRARRWQVGLVFAQASTSSFDGGWPPVLSEHSRKRLVLMQVNAVCVEV
jgi:hypothetical protein